jgi:predicted Zn finger-like uncharacterized protein
VPAQLEAGAMILSCPVCQTRYRVDEEALERPGGRTVRCANCGHIWHQTSAAPEVADSKHQVKVGDSRIEPALEVPPRPGQASGTTLEVPPRIETLLPRPRRRRRRSAVGWLSLVVLLALAVVAAAVAARDAIVARWPPAARLYALAGLPIEPPGAGLKIEKLAPSRTPDGLTIEGDIANTARTPRDLPRLRVALQDAAEKEVQFKVIDPPKDRLAPGAVAHFKTQFEHPNDAATGVVVTLATDGTKSLGSSNP